MQPVLTFRGHQMVSVTRNEGKSCLFFRFPRSPVVRWKLGDDVEYSR